MRTKGASLLLLVPGSGSCLANDGAWGGAHSARLLATTSGMADAMAGWLPSTTGLPTAIFMAYVEPTAAHGKRDGGGRRAIERIR